MKNKKNSASSRVRTNFDSKNIPAHFKTILPKEKMGSSIIEYSPIGITCRPPRDASGLIHRSRGFARSLT